MNDGNQLIATSGRVARAWGLSALALAIAPAHARAQIADDAAGERAMKPAAVARPSPVAQLLAGGGLTERVLHVPTNEGTRNLATGLAPMLSLRVAGRIQDGHRFLRLHIAYQTSVGVQAEETAQDASRIASDTHIRSHRFEAGLAPGLFFASKPQSASLAAFVGYGLRAFGSVAELRVPRFTLHGPLLRLEIELPLLGGRVSVRLAPEMQLVIGLTQQLRAAAGLGRTALAYGAEASVRVHLAGPFAARLCYREAHARSTGSEGNAFEDIERYASLELVFRYD